ncbi:MAG: hypothetical protein B6I37_04900 [Desulfobacteraceae bacterium 4572_35.2]|nr:MAG: hypothetical protein B6I37_04900 [Desulfobacteraceae bacterium 4572_35.2]
MQQQHQQLELKKTEQTLRIDSEQKTIEQLTRTIEESKRLTGEMTPFLAETFALITQQVEQDLPFLSQERQLRLDHLSEGLADPQLAVGEKFRRVMEVLRVETEYGVDIEVAQQSLVIDGRDLLMNQLRIGHYQQRQQQIVAQAEQDEMTARAQAAEIQQQLSHDKQALQQAIRQVRGDVERLTRETVTLAKKEKQLVGQHQRLDVEKSKRTAQLQELVGFIRMAARDVDSLIHQSQLNALNPQRGEVLRPLIEQQRFPGMDEVRSLRDLLLAQSQASGQVQIVKQSILDRQGESITAETVLLGDFSAAYRSADETGFLLYSQPSSRLFALSVLPSGRYQRQIERYLDGESASIPIDVGRGASLRQLTYQTAVTDQLNQGGFIVWPILVIALVAITLIAERIWFLRQNRFDATSLMRKLQPQIMAENWSECEALCRGSQKKALPRVLCAGLKFRYLEREELENVMQEAILAEIPRLERFLSTLAVLASIAPLLGLLGTVTGMINTFQVITFHGTSDPRLMSGGISEALVTTMLGLGVAIPIMLSHSLLSRRVETSIAQIEEKSIRFVNLVCQVRLAKVTVK